ncbi:MAG TPA: porin family protein [Gemmatimonadales bacterium]|nr:porin family protein [Gemmatimonadales bacterium]
MRRLPVLTLLAFTSPLAAQGEHSDLGFQLGYSLAGFTDQPAGLGESRSGSMFGVFLGTPVAGPLSAQAELSLAKKGGGLSTVVRDIPARLSLQLVYIELPLVARVAVPVGGRLHPNLFGGGTVALNIGCDIQAEIPGLIPQQECSDTGGTAVEVHTFDYGLVVGAGVEYDWRHSAARLEVRRTLGLRPVTPGDPAENRAWAILFGITL